MSSPGYNETDVMASRMENPCTCTCKLKNTNPKKLEPSRTKIENEVHGNTI
jgi:hypothetical protein